MFVAYYRETWADRFATAATVVSMSISYLVYIIAFQYLLASGYVGTDSNMTVVTPFANGP